MSEHIRAVIFDLVIWNDELAREWLTFNEFDIISFVSHGQKSLCIVSDREYAGFEYRKCAGFVGISFIIATGDA